MRKSKYDYPANLLLLLTLLFLSTNIFAQNRQKPPMPPDDNHMQKMIDDLTEELSLTQDQQSEIAVLFDHHFNSIKAKHKENREQMENDRKKFESKIMNLLTDEQKEKYSDFLKNYKAPKHKRPKH